MLSKKIDCKKPLSLRSFKGKQLVSFLRNEDYAHAGESEAIEMLMQKIPKGKKLNILDVGCGLGGTANYLQKHQWGKVTGFDIEVNSINYAKANYPNINFYVADVLNVNQVINDRFDLFCLFCSFYAFNDQSGALKALTHLSKDNSQLAIFDYADPLMLSSTPLYRNEEINVTPFKPIKIKEVNHLFQMNGWNITEIVDIRTDFIRWYDDLICKLSSYKPLILDLYSQEEFEEALATYTTIRDSLRENTLTGIILYAHR